MKIVDHEKATAEQIFPQLVGLILRQQPVANLDRVHHRPVIDVIGAIEIHHLLYRTGIDARQPADAFEQMPVGSRVIHGPLP